MTAMTLTTARRTTRPVGLVLGCVAGTCLVVAGIWNALIEDHVTVQAPPTDIGPQVPVAEAMHRYYSWYAGTVAQQRADTILAIVGVTGLVILAIELRRRLGTDVLGRGACTGLQVCGTVWVIGALTEIGGQRAVALMATHSNPIQTVNAISFTTDVTSDAFSAAAFVLLGGAMFAIGIAPVRVAGSRWTLLTGLTGLVALVVAFGYVRGVDSITTWVLGLLAAVLLPAWLVATGRLLDAEQPSLS
ncbi:MAG: hypothetical protein J2P22_02350 [Nocardioides sp.]|nr:hypothetical protein [Nocardioides sp.]